MNDINLVLAEIRSQVTVLKGYSFLLSSDWDDLPEDERRELAGMIHDAVKNVNNLLRKKDVGLESGRSGTGPVSIEKEPKNDRGE
ncbi:MAG: hypothetical protein M3280_08260 [Actinomycetota bacterium]|nr:hypothetical protein [Actinomycetota bacterium]